MPANDPKLSLSLILLCDRVDTNAETTSLTVDDRFVCRRGDLDLELNDLAREIGISHRQIAVEVSKTAFGLRKNLILQPKCRHPLRHDERALSE